MKISRALGSATLIALVAASVVSTNADARSRRPHLNLETLDSFIDDHGLAAAKAANPGMSKTRLTAASTDSTAHVDASGNLVWVDSVVTPSGISAQSIAPNSSDIPVSDFLSLNSRPGSSRTIFLDFDGHTVPAGTAWDPQQVGDPVVAGAYPAFTTDGSAEFSDSEKRIIIDAWSSVAEDYAVFDVNVTTEDPGDAAIDRTNLADQVFGTRALITAGISTWDSAVCNCGGIAYGDVFDLNTDYGYPHAYGQPAFIFVTNDYQSSSNFDGKLIADVASHEVGHNLNLNHDGNASDGEYFQGLDDGTNWAPIMGAGYYNGVVQWSNGDYTSATNHENDLSLISTAGAPLLTDEANSSTSSATSISSTPVDGLINNAADTDYFSVVVSGGTLGVHSFSPSADSNLDTKLTLFNSSGKTLFSTDAPSDMDEAGNGVGSWPVSGLDGVLNADLPNGTYYVAIEGVGRSGAYSDYGSIGAYSVQTRSPSVSSIPTKATPKIKATKFKKGYKVKASYGTWSSGVSITNQWLRDGVPIAGATGKSYKLKSADVGHKISFRAIASKTGYRTAIVVSKKSSKVKR